MNKNTMRRQQIAEAFRIARNNLRLYGFICRVLEYANHSGSEAATRVIQKRLGKHYTLEAWLESRGVRIGRSTESYAALLAHRQAWLDLLIAEFEQPEVTS